MARLSQELQRLFFEEDLTPESGEEKPLPLSGEERSVTLGQMLEVSGERVFGFFMVLMSLPSALPVPAPGYSIPFGVVILLMSLQMVVGSKSPWLPPRMLRRELNRPRLRPLWRQGILWLQRLELLARPRWTPICGTAIGRVILGIFISLMGISMLIPVPGTNTLPAMGIFVTSFGLVEDDGLICTLGLILCVLGGALSAGILFGGISLLDLALDWIREQI